MPSINVLVLGGGGREHALAWRLARDNGVARVFCAPGNAGTAAVAENVPLDPANGEAVAGWVEQHNIALTVIGPELPLTRGVADELSARRRAVFGPTKRAAEIESSKVFAKEFMRRHHVPTAEYEICDSADDARRVIVSGRFSFPLVLKADGLAAGKGVVIADDAATALLAVESMMTGRQFGDAGDRLLIEECLQGPEVSMFALCDGARAMAFGTAQDHKRAYDDDRGPNTGGMGAFAPSPLVNRTLADHVAAEIIDRTVDGLRREGRPFCGFLYAGLMLTSEGPKVLEFNARLGDPEAQVVLPALTDDLSPLLLAAAAGRLPDRIARFEPDARVGVVVASAGYPEHYEVGKPIHGLDEADALPGVLTFHAGTAMRGDSVITSGGRVLTVVGSGPDYRAAMACAYDGVKRIAFEGMRFRTDIGRKAVDRRP